MGGGRRPACGQESSLASAKEICSPQDGRGGRAGVDGSLVRAVQRGLFLTLTLSSGTTFSVMKTYASSHRERELGTEGP